MIYTKYHTHSKYHYLSKILPLTICNLSLWTYILFSLDGIMNSDKSFNVDPENSGCYFPEYVGMDGTTPQCELNESASMR